MGTTAMPLMAASWLALAGTSPNERINVGFIGVGGMGVARLRQFMKHPDVRVGGVRR